MMGTRSRNKYSIRCTDRFPIEALPEVLADEIQTLLRPARHNRKARRQAQGRVRRAVKRTLARVPEPDMTADQRIMCTHFKYLV